MTTCERCGRKVNPAEAAVSRRALGSVLCAGCRSTGEHPDHERDARLEARETRGYGLWEVRRAGAFIAGGLTREAALYRARLVTQQEGGSL